MGNSFGGNINKVGVFLGSEERFSQTYLKAKN